MTTPHDPDTEPVTTPPDADRADPDGDFLDEGWLEARRSSTATKVLVGLVLVGLGFLAGVTVGRAAADAAARGAAGPTSFRSPGGGGGGGGTPGTQNGGGAGAAQGGAQSTGGNNPNVTGVRGSASPSATRSASAGGGAT